MKSFAECAFLVLVARKNFDGICDFDIVLSKKVNIFDFCLQKNTKNSI